MVYKSNKKILIVIPARGGSKGIPRKNLRLLNHKPLISYSILNAKKISQLIKNVDIVLSSDDEEILSVGFLYGVEALKREASLSDAKATLDPVIENVVKAKEKSRGYKYDIIITLQPTSPLLEVDSIVKGIRELQEKKVDTVISAIEDTHLSWSLKNEHYIPNFKKRLNRQYLTPNFKETGGFVVCQRSNLKAGSRIGKKVHLVVLNQKEGIDIDNYEDWSLCEYYLKRKKILFVVSGYPKIGLGHVYNCLILAGHILNHSIEFLVDKKSDLAKERISSANYEVYQQKSANIVDDILKLSPELVINDCLNTTKKYIQSLKKSNLKVINFEDLGMGSKYADRVINAMYPDHEDNQLIANHYYGERYFCLRNEFLISPSKKVVSKVSNVLLSFGGVDPNNYTKKVLSSIYEYCMSHSIQLSVICGFGYENYKSIEDYKGIKIIKDCKSMASEFLKADLIFTSAGRTTFEIASIGTPAIVLAQNSRELTHFFAYKENGFLNLGLGTRLSQKKIKKEFIGLINDFDKRKTMSQRMINCDLKLGAKRVVEIINQFIAEGN